MPDLGHGLVEVKEDGVQIVQLLHRVEALDAVVAHLDQAIDQVLSGPEKAGVVL